MKGPNFRSVKESDLKLGPKAEDLKKKQVRKESIGKRPPKKKKISGIDSFFVKPDSEDKSVKDEKERIRRKNLELLEKFKKEPEKEVSISWEKSSELSYSLNKGVISYGKELEEILRTLEVEGAGAGIQIWEGFFDAVRKLLKEVQDLKEKVNNISKSISEHSGLEEQIEKAQDEIKVEIDERMKMKEERIKHYKEEGTWLNEDEWRKLNDAQKALKRFHFSDKHQNMIPYQFKQLNSEEKEKFMLSKLQWRLKRRKELLKLKENEENKLQVEKALRDLEFFNGRYFDFKKRRWKKIQFNGLLYDEIYYGKKRKSRSWNGSSDPYYL